MLSDFSLFLQDALRSATTGTRRYHIWMGSLTVIIMIGLSAYGVQLREGLIVTGMNDYVSWGLYISNFTFLVGMAAASVMLVLPAYVLHDMDFSKAVLMGEGLAVTALFMCLAFVIVDLGSPEKMWHLIPLIGYFNWPQSMLTWDILVLNGYLALNLGIPLYLLFTRYRGQEPDKRKYLVFIFISVFWAVSIHLVTAFLYAGLPARPFWYSSLLGPRFLASAFASGPSLIILILATIQRFTGYSTSDSTIGKLALIVTVASQISIVMLVSELFKEFYFPTEHSQSAQYIFWGIGEYNALAPWIWTSLLLIVVATVVLSINPLRRQRKYLYSACLMLFIGIWIEKGMGLIVPGFIPSSWGEIVEYTPTWIEILVTLGIWGMGAFIFTVLIKIALPIELGRLRIVREEVIRKAPVKNKTSV